jgi:hypothetical protein
MSSKLYVALLHDGMVDKTGKAVTTSLTLNDMQDMARSSRTFGAEKLFVVHSTPAMRKLAKRLQTHWLSGFGSTYNADRKEAMSFLVIASDLEEIIMQVESETGKLPKLVATSAKNGPNRISYSGFRKDMESGDDSYILMFGTGWGMGHELMARANITLEPIVGPGEYNHLSVRSACAISLDRLRGK